MRQRTRHWLILALAMFIACQPVTADSISDTAVSDSVEPQEIQDIRRSLVYTMSIEGAIGATTAERIEEAVGFAEDDDAELLVIFLDTPGGLSNATWGINKTILNSHVPVCVYIAPLGATAGSAGVYITYSAHFAAMAPAANIGAAHPVGGGG